LTKNKIEYYNVSIIKKYIKSVIFFDKIKFMIIILPCCFIFYDFSMSIENYNQIDLNKKVEKVEQKDFNQELNDSSNEKIKAKEKLEKAEKKESQYEQNIYWTTKKWSDLLQEDPNKIELPDKIGTFPQKLENIKEAASGKWKMTIPSFQSKLKDWTKVEVRNIWSDFIFHIESKNVKSKENKEVTINFENVVQKDSSSDQKNQAQMRVNITSNIWWKEQLKDVSLTLDKIFPKWINNVNIDNKQDISELVEKIDNFIVSPRQQEIHAHAKQNEEKRRKDFDVATSWLELFLKYYDNDKKINQYAHELIKIDDLWNKSLDRKAMYYDECLLLSAIKILSRNYSLKEIAKRINPYKDDVQESTQKNANTKHMLSWEEIVEFISQNPSFINKKNEIILMAKKVANSNWDVYDEIINLYKI